jgi:pyruvate dehydrogenase E1 component alpha subunit
MDAIFDNLYAEPHALIAEQKAWAESYESSFGEGQA